MDNIILAVIVGVVGAALACPWLLIMAAESVIASAVGTGVKNAS